MTLRDRRQEEFVNTYVHSNRFGIFHLCPRFGKCRVGVKIFRTLNVQKVLIAYPDYKIAASWEQEFEDCGYFPQDVTYTTHLSMKNHIGRHFDMVIIDEIHLLSEAQVIACQGILKTNKTVLGLSGTLSKGTKKYLLQALKLPILGEYSIEQGIKEGVVSDYEITVVKVPLDDIMVQDFGKKRMTEKKRFDDVMFINKKKDKEADPSFFIKLMLIRILQNSVSKVEKIKELISEYPGERLLVFAGLITIADSLGIPSYHGETEDKQSFDRFANGDGNHLAVVKIGNTGVTYKPLNRVIIGHIDSNSENLTQKINRCMSFEYDNPDKIAKIIIICSTEPIELKWLKKALEFFDKSKITYI